MAPRLLTYEAMSTGTCLRLITLAARCLALSLLLWMGGVPTAFADTNLVNSRGWVVDGATDPGPDPRDIAVSVDGRFVGLFSELKIAHEVGRSGFRQIYSVKGSGALRPTVPPAGDDGATFYMTGYWDCEQGLIPNLSILELNITLTSRTLQLSGIVSNLDSFEATDFTLRFSPPTAKSVRVEARYTLLATRAFCVDEIRQDQDEGFRIAHIASNFVSDRIHDSTQARYFRSSELCGDVFGEHFCVQAPELFCADLVNQEGFIFRKSRRMGKPQVSLVHADAAPRNTPTLVISFLSPPRGRIRPQGFVTPSTEPDVDNVALWGNWRDAKSVYEPGEEIGEFRYTLEAKPPGRLARCDSRQR